MTLEPFAANVRTMDQTPFTPGPTPPPDPPYHKPVPKLGPTPPPVWQLIVNGLVFQAVWFACVIGAANGTSWPGLAAAATAIALHLAMTRDKPLALGLILFAVAVGLLGETVLIWSGSVRYALGAQTLPFPPPWLLAMWAAFGTLPALSLNWLASKPILASIFGLVLGPLAYIAGERLGGIIISRPLLYSVDGIALLWAIALPALLLAYRGLQAPTEPEKP